MDGTIKVSTQELRSASSQFSSYGSEIQNLTSQMLSLISGITGAVWSGEAASAYQSKFAGLEADISKINKMIQEHVTDLNTMADEYDRAEQQAQQDAAVRCHHTCNFFFLSLRQQAQQEASALKNNII